MQRIMQGSAYIQSDEHEAESETPSRPIDTNTSINRFQLGAERERSQSLKGMG